MTTETATLAGGCFWCTEAIFARLNGVISVTPGYSGGITQSPSYDDVCSGKTKHAEAIQIIFDPNVISFDKILEIFWHTHNPTTLNRQGNDTGTQYRSVIFYHTEEQRIIAEISKSRLEKQETFADPIVTEITAFANFYPAEDYHQRYFEKHNGQPYCDMIIAPKVQKLLEQYRGDVKTEFVSD